MKLLVPSVLFFFSVITVTHAKSTLTFKGSISRVVIGEMDPFVLGDTCLIEMTTTQGEILGFATDFEACDENRNDLTEGRGLTVTTAPEERIQDAATSKLLTANSKAKVFYQVGFEAIENGLADVSADESNVVVVREKLKTLATCTHGEGGYRFQLGLAENKWLKSKYEVIVVHVKEDGAAPVMYWREIAKVSEHGSTSVYQSELALLKLTKKESQAGTLKVNLETESFALIAITMDCALNSSIEYDTKLILEPRVSAGN